MSKRRRSTLPLLILTGLLVGAAYWYYSEEYRALREGTRTLADSGQYQGQLLAGQLHGHGVITWPNGARYEGEFENGLFSGHGSYHDGAGNHLIGRFVKGLANGEGRLEFADGSIYEGDFFNGHMHGEGTYTGVDGVKYQGELKLGRFDGTGEYTDFDGSYYAGEFSLGRFDGYGTYTRANGDVYAGEFERGRLHGKGQYTFAGNGQVFSGEFVNSDFTGMGTHTDPEGNQYIGEFKDWRYHGEGRFETIAGDVYEGVFYEGNLNGPGVHSGRDGDRYEGEFKNWLYSGHGKYTDPDGNIYEGEFQSGLFHGRGTLTYASPRDDKTEVTGEWLFGRHVAEIEEEMDFSAEIEQALYRQGNLLQEALDSLQPQREEHIDLYFLAVAGDGTQEVFRREVEFIHEQFDRDFDTRSRSITLVNSRTAINQYPMATTYSIEQALKAMADRMDPEEDILFLYLTTHGNENRKLKIDHHGLDLPDLSADHLARIFAELPIKWKVVVISACFSGGFIESLRDDHSLIMTAARHDRHSFGCTDDARMTYFGRAFFKESLPNARSFTEAFEAARILVRDWESKYETKSKPQIHAPAPILEHLQQWNEQSGAFIREPEP